MGAAGAAGAAAAAGGGKSPVAFEAKLDLTDAYNRVVDSWFNVFTGTSSTPMTQYACAYPGEFTESEIRDIAQYTRAEDQHLRWNMIMDTNWPWDEASYNLKVDWEGRYYESSAGYGYYFIENAVAWVDWGETGYGWKLNVDVQFGKPNFYNGIANMIVDFHVKESDGGGDIHRDTHRRWRIYADGTRQRI